MLKYDGRHHVISVLLNEKEIEIEYMKKPTVSVSFLK